MQMHLHASLQIKDGVASKKASAYILQMLHGGPILDARFVNLSEDPEQFAFKFTALYEGIRCMAVVIAPNEAAARTRMLAYIDMVDDRESVKLMREWIEHAKVTKTPVDRSGVLCWVEQS